MGLAAALKYIDVSYCCMVSVSDWMWEAGNGRFDKGI